MITLQFSTQADIASALIRHATWSEFSHVDVVLADGTLLGARIDGGVKIRPAGYGKFTKITQYKTLFSAPDIDAKILQFLHDQLGKPYDWRGILNFALQNTRDWRADDSWFCSELVAAAFEVSGMPLLRLRECDRVSPRDLTLSTLLEAS